VQQSMQQLQQSIKRGLRGTSRAVKIWDPLFVCVCMCACACECVHVCYPVYISLEDTDQGIVFNSSSIYLAGLAYRKICTKFSYQQE
jgi:hypothetical protein